MTTTEPASTTRGEVAGTTPTAEDGFIPPGQDALLTEQQTDPLYFEREVNRLTNYLHSEFPGEVDRTNVQRPETSVETAIRLLAGLSAAKPPSETTHCPEQYCNKPAGHLSPHGWVHKS